MLDRLWIAFKLIFSAVLVAAPIAFFVAAPRALKEPAFIGVAALMLFFAALPWVNFTGPSRGLALAGVFSSVGMTFIAGQTAFGFVQFPRPCSGRSVVFCESQNLLFAVGGEQLAAAPFALVAAFLFAGSFRMLTRVGRTR